MNDKTVYRLRGRPVGAARGFVSRSRGCGWGNDEGNRLFVEAVIYRYRLGISWRDLLERFGERKNIHRCHQ